MFAPVFRYDDYSPEKLAVRFKDYADGGPEVVPFTYLQEFGD